MSNTFTITTFVGGGTCCATNPFALLYKLCLGYTVVVVVVVVIVTFNLIVVAVVVMVVVVVVAVVVLVVVVVVVGHVTLHDFLPQYFIQVIYAAHLFLVLYY